MDISVSRLNNRLALQLPTELPLGLVFVVGTVENITWINDGDEQTHITSSRRIELELKEEEVDESEQPKQSPSL